MGLLSGQHVLFVLPLLLLCLVVTRYIVLDARRRNQSGLLWGLISLFFWPAGAVMWFLVRRGMPVAM